MFHAEKVFLVTPKVIYYFKYYLMSCQKTLNVFWSLTMNVMSSKVMTEVIVYSVLFSLNFRL